MADLLTTIPFLTMYSDEFRLKDTLLSLRASQAYLSKPEKNYSSHVTFPFK